MKPLAIALSGERGPRGRDDGGDLTKVQCNAIQNRHNESPLYKEYILIKMKKKKKEIVVPGLKLLRLVKILHEMSFAHSLSLTNS
jgi:hypothetical protein